MKTLNLSALKIKNNLPYFEIPEMAKLGWTRHAFLTRNGGVSLSPYHTLNLGRENGDQEENVIENKMRIARTFNFDPKCLVLLHQVHQDRILLLRQPDDTLPALLEYDAVITDVSNMFVGIRTADCIPILILDQRKRVISAIHAGRQGTALHITTKVLRKMGEEFGCSPEDLLIALGPSVGSCCYEIDEGVFHPEWEVFSTRSGKGKWMVDLARINVAHMKNEGSREEQIHWVDLCTGCHVDTLFSHRKEGRTGRQLSFIGILE
jgi:YfiH family protein